MENKLKNISTIEAGLSLPQVSFTLPNRLKPLPTLAEATRDNQYSAQYKAYIAGRDANQADYEAYAAERDAEYAHTMRNLSDYNDPNEINSLSDVAYKWVEDISQSTSVLDLGKNVLSVLPNTADMSWRTFYKPLLERDWNSLMFNSLYNFSETADVIANPVKGYAMEGTDGFKKAIGWGDYGRVNYDWDTGNLLQDIGLEVISDPLNWITLGGKAIATGAAKSMVESANKELISSLGEKGAKNLTKAIAKNLGKGADEAVDIALEALKRSKNKALLGNLDDQTIVFLKQGIMNANSYNVIKNTMSVVNKVDMIDDAIIKVATNSALGFAPAVLRHAFKAATDKGFTTGMQRAYMSVVNRVVKSAEPYLRPGTDIVKLDQLGAATTAIGEQIKFNKLIDFAEGTQLTQGILDIMVSQSVRFEEDALRAILRDNKTGEKLADALDAYVKKVYPELKDFAGYVKYVDDASEFVTKFGEFRTLRNIVKNTERHYKLAVRAFRNSEGLKELHKISKEVRNTHVSLIDRMGYYKMYTEAPRQLFDEMNDVIDTTLDKLGATLNDLYDAEASVSYATAENIIADLIERYEKEFARLQAGKTMNLDQLLMADILPEFNPITDAQMETMMYELAETLKSSVLRSKEAASIVQHLDALKHVYNIGEASKATTLEALEQQYLRSLTVIKRNQEILNSDLVKRSKVVDLVQELSGDNGAILDEAVKAGIMEHIPLKTTEAFNSKEIVNLLVDSVDEEVGKSNLREFMKRIADTEHYDTYHLDLLKIQLDEIQKLYDDNDMLNPILYDYVIEVAEILTRYRDHVLLDVKPVANDLNTGTLHELSTFITDISGLVQQSYEPAMVSLEHNAKVYQAKVSQIQSNMSLYTAKGLSEFTQNLTYQRGIGAYVYGLFHDPAAIESGVSDSARKLASMSEGINNYTHLLEDTIHADLPKDVIIPFLDTIQTYAKIPLDQFSSGFNFYLKEIAEKAENQVNFGSISKRSISLDAMTKKYGKDKEFLALLKTNGIKESTNHDATYDILINKYAYEKEIGDAYAANKAPIYFDIETVGLNRSDQIFQLAYYDNLTGRVTELRARADVMPPNNVVKKTMGINDLAAAQAKFREVYMNPDLPSEEELLKEFNKYINSYKQGRIQPQLIGQNIADFDLPHITARNRHNGIRNSVRNVDFIDTLREFRAKEGYREYSLREKSEIRSKLKDYIDSRDAELFDIYDGCNPVPNSTILYKRFIESPDQEFTTHLAEINKDASRLVNGDTAVNSYTETLTNLLSETISSLSEIKGLNRHLGSYYAYVDEELTTKLTDLGYGNLTAYLNKNNLILNPETGKKEVAKYMATSYRQMSDLERIGNYFAPTAMSKYADELPATEMLRYNRAAKQLDRYRNAIDKLEYLEAIADDLTQYNIKIHDMLMNYFRKSNMSNWSLEELVDVDNAIGNPLLRDLVFVPEDLKTSFAQARYMTDMLDSVLEAQKGFVKEKPYATAKLKDYLTYPHKLNYSSTDHWAGFIDPKLLEDSVFEVGFDLYKDILPIADRHKEVMNMLREVETVQEKHLITSAAAKTQYSAMQDVYSGFKHLHDAYDDIMMDENLTKLEVRDKLQAIKDELIYYQNSLGIAQLDDVLSYKPQDMLGHLYWESFGRIVFDINDLGYTTLRS